MKGKTIILLLLILNLTISAQAPQRFYTKLGGDGIDIDKPTNMAVYIMDYDGANLRRLTDTKNEDFWPSWSPDGEHIVFTSNRNKIDSEIYIMDSDGSNQINLTNNSGNDWLPFWSPDGKYIYFSSRRDGNAEIYVMNKDGTEQINLTNTSFDDFFAIPSPDGLYLAFTSVRDGIENIYMMQLDNDNIKQITTRQAAAFSTNWLRIKLKEKLPVAIQK